MGDKRPPIFKIALKIISNRFRVMKVLGLKILETLILTLTRPTGLPPHAPVAQKSASTPQFHTDPLSSTPKTPQFNIKTTSVPHLKPLSSTPKTPQFHTKKDLL